MINYLRANNTIYLNISMKKIIQVLQEIELMQEFDLNNHFFKGFCTNYREEEISRLSCKVSTYVI